jgi:putative tricarboxylic transport membrane protein
VLGTYSIRFNLFDVWAMIGFGILGYFMRKLEIPTAPLMLALVLAPMMESALGQSLTISDGSPMVFLTRPMSLVLVLLAAVSLVTALYSRLRGWRVARAFGEASSE